MQKHVATLLNTVSFIMFMKHALKIIIVIIVLSMFLMIFYIAKPKVAQLNTEDYKTQSLMDQLRFINDNMVSGGPPKDGIPSIDQPEYVGNLEADFLQDDDIVFGVHYKGQVRAYPQKILYWHEIVNDNFVGDDLSITYCPLTGSVIGYKGHNLGVSGNLYNSNLVMYDRSSQSEIPQIIGVAVNGRDRGVELKRFPIVVTTWKQWREKFPQTEVLSLETGYNRNYDRNPYPGYDETLRVWFPLVARSSKFHSKKVVSGFAYKGTFIAIPKEEFKKKHSDTVTVEGNKFLVSYDEALDIIRVSDTLGNELIVTDMYWFAWYAYHPDTVVLDV